MVLLSVSSKRDTLEMVNGVNKSDIRVNRSMRYIFANAVPLGKREINRKSQSSHHVEAKQHRSRCTGHDVDGKLLVIGSKKWAATDWSPTRFFTPAKEKLPGTQLSPAMPVPSAVACCQSPAEQSCIQQVSSTLPRLVVQEPCTSWNAKDSHDEKTPVVRISMEG